jgi:hypothetical protein
VLGFALPASAPMIAVPPPQIATTATTIPSISGVLDFFFGSGYR